jgi:hypothetical protein
MQERATKGWPEGRGRGNERVKEHGEDLGGTRAFAVQMGQQELSKQACQILDFFCQSQHAGTGSVLI